VERFIVEDGGAENAGVTTGHENEGQNRMGGKCRTGRN